MHGLFDYDSKVASLISKITDCIILGFFWLVCSVPVFTIGASSTALYYAVDKSIIHNRGYAWKEFVTSFKDNFKQTTQIWVIILCAYILGWADCVLLSKFGMDFPLSKVSIVVVRTGMFMVTLWVLYLFPYMARFTDGKRSAMKKSALIAAANLPWTLLLLAILVVAVLFAVVLPIASIVLPVMYMLVANLILERIFRKYMPLKDIQEETERNRISYRRSDETKDVIK